MKVYCVFVSMALAILFIAGVLQDREMDRMRKEQAEQREQTNELAGVVLTFYRAQKEKNADVEFNRKIDNDAWKRIEEIMILNVSRGKLILPEAK